MNAFSWPQFERLPIIGILRGFEGRLLPRLIEAVVQGGLTTLEITMNSPGAASQIAEAVQFAAGRLNIGAGTVLTPELLDEALDAGASFIVTPGLQLEVLRRCVDLHIPVFPGAFSPTEMVRVQDSGTPWVKLFPAEALGPGFVREVKAAFDGLKLLPTGGVSLENLPRWVEAGADGAGLGSPLFAPERVRAEDWTWVTDRCRAFATIWTQSHSALIRGT